MPDHGVEACCNKKPQYTAEGRVGIAPSKFITFVSTLYGGHISYECGLLGPGNDVMAIQYLLAQKI